MENHKIVIFGADGMLGTALVKAFENYKVYALSKSKVDITNKDYVFDWINKLKPGVVINSAAYTDVDGCEKNKKHAFNVNGRAVKAIACACKKNRSLLIHISTDYVFDGRKKFYKENDKVNPINTYGKSKALGEKNLMENSDDYYLIRTSWLFGPNGENFVDTILSLAKEKRELKVVNDQFGKPTYTIDIAKQIKEMVDVRKASGIYHVTNEGICNWFQFAKKIIKLAKFGVKIIPISSNKINMPARRPKYSVLLNTKLRPLRHWQLAIKEYMDVK